MDIMFCYLKKIQFIINFESFYCDILKRVFPEQCPIY